MTRRLLLGPSVMVSPGRQLGTAVSRILGRPVLELEDEGHSVLPSVVGWDRTAGRGYAKGQRPASFASHAKSAHSASRLDASRTSRKASPTFP